MTDKEGDCVTIMAGGKISNRISSSQVLEGRGGRRAEQLTRGSRKWSSVVKQIIEAYAKDAKKYERIGDWAERIGWEKFFDKCGIPFSAAPDRRLSAGL